VRLDHVVLRALEQQPEKRYQRAGDVKTDVEAVSRMGPAAAELKMSRDQGPTASRPAGKSWSTGAIVALVVALVLVVMCVPGIVVGGMGLLGASIFWMTPVHTDSQPPAVESYGVPVEESSMDRAYGENESAMPAEPRPTFVPPTDVEFIPHDSSPTEPEPAADAAPAADAEAPYPSAPPQPARDEFE
jgi:hypothetical protein